MPVKISFSAYILTSAHILPSLSAGLKLKNICKLVWDTADFTPYSRKIASEGVTRVVRHLRGN
jgi:hypothetical protein